MGRQLLRHGDVIDNRYTITGPFIGEGSFSEVYPAEDHDTKAQVAVKVEKNHAEKAVMNSELRALQDLQKTTFVCRLLGSGSHKCHDKQEHQFIAMQRVGSTLAELRKAREPKRFSWHTTRAVGLHMLDALRALHDQGYIHRDVKPANFTIGYGSEKRRIFIIDFGLARKFTDGSGNVQVQRSNAAFRGSSKYASIYAHQNEDLGRRDDVWSLFYVLVECLDGALPWTDEARNDKNVVLRMKQDHLDRPSDLTQNVKLPPEMCELCSYLRTLNFADEPDYARIRNILGGPDADAACAVEFDWELAPAVPAAMAAPAGQPSSAPWYTEPTRGAARPAHDAVEQVHAKRARLANSEPPSRVAAQFLRRDEDLTLRGLSEAGRDAARSLCNLPPNEVVAVINSVLCGMWELHEQKGELSGVLRDLAHVASSFRDRAQDAALARR